MTSQDNAVELADAMSRRHENRTISPHGNDVEAAAGALPNTDAEEDDGQLGPDEISDPDEVIKNHEAKHHL
jgi:hypothetical protein